MSESSLTQPLLPSQPPAKQILVIGAGIAGLSAAYYLRQSFEANKLPYEVRVLEAGPRVGGKINTVHQDGFTMEAGPDSFLTEKPWGLELCRELGLENELLPCDEENRLFFIRHKGVFHPFPQGMRLFIPTSLKPMLTTRLLSPLGKLRLGLEMFIPRRKEGGDESLAEFVTRRCGREAMERLAAPILAGIYAADPNKLSMHASFPNLVALEDRYGSLTKGIRTLMARSKNGPKSAVFTSLKGGVGQLADTLAEVLQEHIHLQSPAQELRIKAGKFECITPNATYTADSVILAIGSNKAAPLVRNLHAPLARSLESQPFTSSITVSMGYTRPSLPYGKAPRGFGFMIPSYENTRLLGATWSSNKFPGRAPDHHFLLRLFYAGQPADELMQLDDRELLKIAREDAAQFGTIDAEPVVSSIARWPKGNPQYEKGHLVWLEHLDRELSRVPSMFLAGSSYTGISMSDCVKHAKILAEKVTQHLAQA